MPVSSNPEKSLPRDSEEPQENRGHVLVVDDDLEMLRTIEFALKDAGFEVSKAPDGNLGLAIAETKNPDLIVLDLMMPKRSGFLVLEWLRQYVERPVPVIVITANDGKRHQKYAEMLGVSDYIHKPFTMERLLESVNNLLTK